MSPQAEEVVELINQVLEDIRAYASDPVQSIVNTLTPVLEPYLEGEPPPRGWRSAIARVRDSLPSLRDELEEGGLSGAEASEAVMVIDSAMEDIEGGFNAAGG